MATEYVYRKNPKFGEPGEPEMLDPEIIQVGPDEVPSETEGRNLTMGEFLKVGYALGLAEQIDSTLVSMPSLGMFLQQYLTLPGIEYADAVPAQQPSTIRVAFQRMKAAGHIDDAKIAQFLALWVSLYPKTVSAT